MKTLWPTVQLGKVLRQQNTAVSVSELTEINLAGVYSFARGLFKRGPMSPRGTSYKAYNRLVPDDFVMSIPKAWEGALARITPEFDGWFLSPVFATFRANREAILPTFLEWYCKQKSVWMELRQKSRGIGARRESVSPEQFLSLQIPLPTLYEQQRIVARIDSLAAKVNNVRHLQNECRSQIEALFASKLRATISEFGNKVRYVPFTELARLERRPVSIELEKFYQEIGVYCFGKGIFHKIPRTGAEVGAKDLFKISAGDFILQITFAWEGAIALAESKDDGLFGSVRYLTFRVNENACSSRYLLTYMKTADGIRQLGRISPGSAGRNRVLSVKRLNEVIVPIVPLSAQAWLTKEINMKVAQLKSQQDANAAELDALLPSILDKAFKGELFNA